MIDEAFGAENLCNCSDPGAGRAGNLLMGLFAGSCFPMHPHEIQENGRTHGNGVANVIVLKEEHAYENGLALVRRGQ